GNYENVAATTITDQIDPATASISVAPYHVTYDATAHTASATPTFPTRRSSDLDLDLSHTVHTNAGTYGSDSWTFTDPTGNYKNVTATTITDQIDPATASISVAPYHVTYDATAHTASGTATGVGGVNLASDLDLNHTANAIARTYDSDPLTFTAPTGNYKNVAATTITDQIDQATASITVTPYHEIGRASGREGAGTAAGVGGVNLESDLDLSHTANTNAGTYGSDSWTFTDPTANK